MKDEARPAPVYNCGDCGFTFQLLEGYGDAKVVCPRCGKPPKEAAAPPVRTVTR